MALTARDRVRMAATAAVDQGLWADAAALVTASISLQECRWGWIEAKPPRNRRSVVCL
jgi:hypothetical protein